jgi:hypothetical protein
VSVGAVLDRARAAGIELQATPDGKIRWGCQGALPADLQAGILRHKAELLVLLQPFVPAWDQAEADRLLADLRQTAARLKAQQPGGRFPEVLGRVVGDLLAVAEDYATGHQREAARGWDSLELLRGVQADLLTLVGRYRREHPSPNAERGRQ